MLYGMWFRVIRIFMTSANTNRTRQRLSPAIAVTGDERGQQRHWRQPYFAQLLFIIVTVA